MLYLCQARGRQELRFDDAAFRGFHLYDLDFSFRAFLGGYRVAVATDLAPIHASAGAFDQQWSADAERFIARHHDQLAAPLGRPFRSGSTALKTRDELLEVMTQPDWEAPIP